MKLLLLIGYLAIMSIAQAQPRKTDFFQVDQYALSVETGPAEELALKLTADCKTDLEKTRAIFRWITENISYRTPGKRVRNPVIAEKEDTGALKPLDERVAETVLQTRLALCDGYARTFKTLCSFAGIRSELVFGYARTEPLKRIQRFRSNHTWNAVYIDSNWHLLDVTWASGYIENGTDRFVRYFDEQYFLSKPEEFIREHYPDDLAWTLMPEPPLMPEFKHSPFRQRAFVKYKIAQFSPASGLIDAKVGDTLRFQLLSQDRKADENISADPFLDQSLYSSFKTALVKPLSSKGNLVEYNYIVISPSVQWLYLLYNDDVILRYRVNIKTAGTISVLAAMD